MTYANPGALFLRKFGPVCHVVDVMRYVAFLRDEAGLGIEPPIDLSLVYRRFEIPVPALVPLPNQQGLLVNSERGVILINEGDLATRRRFTEAHEVIELLFSAQPSGIGWAARRAGAFKMGTKEQLCNEGAAELLMPRESFVPRLKRMGISFQAAWFLSEEYRVSATAALVHMVRLGKGHHAVVVWRMKNKPIEIGNKAPKEQLSLFNEMPKPNPPMKLRVEWSFGGPTVPFIPQDKSVPEESSIHSAWRDGSFTIGEDVLHLGTTKGKFKSESQPFESNDERLVISLLHFPSDEEECRKLR